MMMDGMMMMDGVMGGWMWLLLLLVVIVITAVIAVLVGSAASGRRTDTGPSPRQILDRRYAQDELTREEYLQRCEDLKR